MATVKWTDWKQVCCLSPATHLQVGNGHTWGSTCQSHSVACNLLACNTWLLCTQFLHSDNSKLCRATLGSPGAHHSDKFCHLPHSLKQHKQPQSIKYKHKIGVLHYRVHRFLPWSFSR